jgi:hypothetical protein
VGSQLIRVSSRALGERVFVRVLVYDTLEEMRAAAWRYNGNDVSEAAAVTQALVDQDGRAGMVTVRLARDRLGCTVVAHEMHHAATALYGAHVGDRVSRLAHLNHFNEPFAYLFSDLYGALVRRLYALGYYEN